MTTSPSVGFANPVALTVKKGASTASVTLSRYGDGTIEFTDKFGVRQRFNSNVGLKSLFDAIAALV